MTIFPLTWIPNNLRWFLKHGEMAERVDGAGQLHTLIHEGMNYEEILSLEINLVDMLKNGLAKS